MKDKDTTGHILRECAQKQGLLDGEKINSDQRPGGHRNRGRNWVTSGDDRTPENRIVMIVCTDDWALKTTKMYLNMGTVFPEHCHLTKKKVKGLPLWNDSSTWNMTFRDCNGSTEEIAQHRIRSTLRIYSRIGSIE